MDKLQFFPKGFLWGAATSAHQVEGNTENDWAEWERKNADRLASESKHHFGHLPNWPDIIKAGALDPNNYISGRACDHYSRFREDFDIAKSLGHNAHRLSIEWSRVEPEEGHWDEKEIGHYRDVIKVLRARGIEPFVTLWHWTLPIWLKDHFGVAHGDFSVRFARYAERMAEALGDEVTYWITFNEPNVYVAHAYLRGDWPPHVKSFSDYIRALRNFAAAHRNAYGLIKDMHPHAQVGIAKNNIFFDVPEPTRLNRTLKKFADWWWNRYFLDRIAQVQDFIGLNHYFHSTVRRGFNKNENERISDMGTELYPEAIYHTLSDLKRYHKPIYITENGLADAHDSQREWFIRESLGWVHKALGAGIDVRGYFHWSLLDNFEWDKGFWPRFGLVEVDRTTLERKIRPSALAYKKIIEANGL